MDWKAWLLKLMIVAVVGSAFDMLSPTSSSRNYLRFLWGIIMLSVFIEPALRYL